MTAAGEDEEMVRNVTATIYAGAFEPHAQSICHLTLVLPSSRRRHREYTNICSRRSEWLIIPFLCQTNASVHAFILAMAMFPEVQHRAQAELDAVVSPDRLPELDDHAALPYMRALVKEVLRWHVVAPIGVPHRSVDDDEYNGFNIPGGSIVFVNAWCVDHLLSFSN